MELKIKKAKLTRSNTIETVYIDEDGNEITLKGKNGAHADLKKRLAELIPYFAELTEQKEADAYDWDNPDSQENADLMRRLDVSGVSLGGDDNSPIATLTGRRTLMTSKVLNLNTPPTDLNADDSGWSRADDFRFAIDAFFYEVEQYVTERKWETKQLDLDFGENDDPFAEADPTAEAAPIGAPDNPVMAAENVA